MTNSPHPPTPVEGRRIRLRSIRASDADGLLELATSAEVRQYLGGPQDADEARREIETALARGVQRPGNYVVATRADDVMLGMVAMSLRSPERPGHLSPEGDELELSYQLLPTAWGCGYAAEASRLVLHAYAQALPGQPVLLVTQTANKASMRLARRLGFSHVETFTEFDAEQWLGTAPLHHWQACPQDDGDTAR